MAKLPSYAWPLARTFLLFLFIALASLVLTKLQGSVAAVWPANAVLLVTMLRSRPALRPALAAVAYAANVIADLAASDTLWRALTLSSLNVLEVVIALVALSRFLGDGRDLVRPRRLAIFIAVAVLAPIPSAALSALALSTNGGFSLDVFRSWWSADALGLLIFAPMTLILFDGASRNLVAPGQRAKALASLGVLLVALAGTFLQSRFPFLFLVPPALTLITFNLGLAGAAWAILITSAFGVAATVSGLGPALLAQTDRPLEVLQFFLAFLVLTTLPLASVLEGRRRLERALTAERDRANATATELATGRIVSGLAQETAGVGFWVYRPRSRTTTWSAHLYELYGLPNDGEVPDFETVMTRFHPDDRPRARAYALKSLETGEEHQLELRITAGPQERTVLARTRPAVLPDGEPALLGVMVDVSAVRAAQAERAVTETRYRLLAETASDIIAVFGTDTRFTYVSPSVERVLGYAPEDLIGKSTSLIMHPDDFRTALDTYRTHLASDRAAEPFFFEYRAYRKDGEMVWLAAHPCAIFDPESGEVTGFQDVVRDVTAQKQMQAALEDSEARYRRLAESVPDLIVRIRGSKIAYASAASRTYGYEPSDLEGRDITDFIHPDDLRGSMERNRANRTGAIDEGARREQRVRTADGRWVWLEGNPQPVMDAAGQVVEVVNVFRDVSSRRALEDQLIAARTAAEHAAQVKTDFMSNMSHELRTPLTAIIGFSSLLKATGGLEGRNAMLVDRVERAGQALLTLVNQVLDYSKIEAGEVKLEAVPVDPRQLAADAVALVTPQAQAKGIRLAAEIPDTGKTFTGDPSRLRQVLVNLLGNAVKFTSEGEIRLSVAPRGRGRLRFSVTDTGCGIPPDRLDMIFDRYTQADSSTTRVHGGTGLGLAICRGLVEAMGGEIGVESQPDTGSTFWFEVPSRPKARRAAKAAKAAEARPHET